MALADPGTRRRAGGVPADESERLPARRGGPIGGNGVPPRLQHLRVVGQSQRALAREVFSELVGRWLLRLQADPLHHRVGPCALDGVTDDENHPHVGQNRDDVLDALGREGRILGSRLSGDAAGTLLEEPRIPAVTAPAKEVAEIPGDSAERRVGAEEVELVSNLPPPALVLRPVAAQVVAEFDSRVPELLVEVVQLLLLGQPRAGVRVEHLMEPGCCRLLRADDQERRRGGHGAVAAGVYAARSGSARRFVYGHVCAGEANQQRVNSELRKKLSSRFPTLVVPLKLGCVPSGWKSLRR